jgi:hypothetical protein
MADDIAITPGAGATVATDQLAGGEHYQLIKLAYGALDTANLVTSTTTNPFPVALSDNDNNLVSTNNSTTSTLANDAVWTATGDDVSAYAAVTVTLDSSHDSAASGMTFQFSTDNSNWDDVYTFSYTAADGSRRFQFPVTSQYFRNVYTNGGVTQTHFRVQTILHKQNVLTSIHNLSADMDPDRSAQVVKSVLYAQAAGSGDFTAVDATAGGNLKMSLEEITDPIGGGTEAAALRVTIANDSTGVVSVDDGGGALTVDGTVTETNSAAIKTAVELIDNAISGTEMQVDVVAALPAGSNAIGKLAANTGVDIGDVDVTSISAGSNLIGDVGISGARTSGGATHYRNIDVDETEDAIKASAGQVYFIQCTNLDATVIYLHFYDAGTGSVTVGTTTPDLTFAVPTQGDGNGAGFVLNIPNGIAFATAITVAATTTVGGAGGPGANEVILNVGYA